MNNFLATKSKLHYAIKRSTTKSFPHLLHTRTHTRSHTLQFYHEEEIFDFCSAQYTAIQMCLDECVHVEVAAMNSIFVLSRSIDYKQNTYVLAHVLCILCFDVCSLLFQFPIHSITFLLSGVVVAVITLVVVNFPILVCYFRRYIRVSRRVQFFSPKSSTHATTHRLTLTHTERERYPYTLIDHCNLIKLAVNFNFHTLIHCPTQRNAIAFPMAHDRNVCSDKNKLKSTGGDWNGKLLAETC